MSKVLNGVAETIVGSLLCSGGGIVLSFQSSVLRHFVIAHIYDTKKLPVPSRYIFFLRG